jgi:hypothetical protein
MLTAAGYLVADGDPAGGCDARPGFRVVTGCPALHFWQDTVRHVAVRAAQGCGLFDLKAPLVDARWPASLADPCAGVDVGWCQESPAWVSSCPRRSI